jgi:hypothetical protein
MTDSKIESAKKLLASGVPPKDVAKNLGVSIPTLYRCASPRTLSVLYFPFSERRPLVHVTGSILMTALGFFVVTWLL